MASPDSIAITSIVASSWGKLEPIRAFRKDRAAGKPATTCLSAGLSRVSAREAQKAPELLVLGIATVETSAGRVCDEPVLKTDHLVENGSVERIVRVSMQNCCSSLAGFALPFRAS